jgi:hypothetical protein
LAKEHDLLDFDSAAKVTGQKFYYTKNEARCSSPSRAILGKSFCSELLSETEFTGGPSRAGTGQLGCAAPREEGIYAHSHSRFVFIAASATKLEMSFHRNREARHCRRNWVSAEGKGKPGTCVASSV